MLAEDELVECGARIAKTGQPNPLDHPTLKIFGVRRTASDHKTDIDKWVERASFFVSEAAQSEATSELKPSTEDKSENPKQD